MTFVQHINAHVGIPCWNILYKGLTQPLRGVLCNISIAMYFSDVMGRRRRKSDVSRSARRRHFTASNRRALNKNNSRSSGDVFGQGESASRRTCKWRSWHPGRQGCFKLCLKFKQRSSHGMARQDKSSSFHMVRASPGKRFCELWRSKVDVGQQGAEGD